MAVLIHARFVSAQLAAKYLTLFCMLKTIEMSNFSYVLFFFLFKKHYFCSA